MKILVAADGSEAALDAVRHVLHLRRQGLNLTLVLAAVQALTYLWKMVPALDSDVLNKECRRRGGLGLQRPPANSIGH
jgi:nucleotide-binding universal stress UspA family protein